MTKFDDNLSKVDHRINALIAKKNNLIKRGQARCKHPWALVRQGESITNEGNFIDGSLPATPPFRVCLKCGYSEDGWEFKKLRHTGRDIPELTRNAAAKYILCEEESIDEGKRW